MVHQVPALRRHTHEVRDLLALDHFQRLLGVPLVHDHQLQAGHPAAHHHRHTARHVEQRHDQNERRRQIIRVTRRVLALTQRINRVAHRKGHQRIDDCSVRRHRTLRTARRTRGVQNRRVVIGGNLRTRVLGTHRQHRLPRIHAIGQCARRTHHQTLDTQPRSRGSTRRITLLVADHHRRTAVFQRVVHLVGGPPRVHRHRHRTNRQNRTKRHHPFRVVAHGDRHAVALLHSVRVHQQRRQRVQPVNRIVERPPLALVHQERLVTMLTGRSKHQPQMRRRILEHVHLDAIHHGLRQLELLPRRSNRPNCLFPRHPHGARALHRHLRRRSGAEGN